MERRLHKRELEILTIVHRSNEPISSQEVVLANPQLSQSTVQAVLRKMLSIGYVEVIDLKHSGNVLTRTYKTTDKYQEEVLEQLVYDYQMVSDVVDFEMFIKRILEVIIPESDENAESVSEKRKEFLIKIFDDAV